MIRAAARDKTDKSSIKCISSWIYINHKPLGSQNYELYGLWFILGLNMIIFFQLFG